MLSKAQIKLITGLHQKKYRNNYGLFIAEGPKLIAELIHAGIELHSLYSQVELNDIHEDFILVTPSELKKISALKNPSTALGVFRIPPLSSNPTQGLVLALDKVRDPGNMGTIIRLADWYDIKDIVCSRETVDCYNPKVVQATMGSIARVRIHYLELPDFLAKASMPVYGGYMEASSIYDQKLTENAILVLGNEGQGISETVGQQIDHRVSIPRFGQQSQTESLNVAMAAAVLINEFRRPIGK